MGNPQTLDEEEECLLDQMFDPEARAVRRPMMMTSDRIMICIRIRIAQSRLLTIYNRVRRIACMQTIWYKQGKSQLVY